MIKVVAALIEKDGKYLIARRSTGDKNVLGKWKFLGGKVKENESEENGIKHPTLLFDIALDDAVPEDYHIDFEIPTTK